MSRGEVGGGELSNARIVPPPFPPYIILSVLLPLVLGVSGVLNWSPSPVPSKDSFRSVRNLISRKSNVVSVLRYEIKENFLCNP